MIVFIIKYCNNINSIKIFNRNKLIYCNKLFDYISSNQLIILNWKRPIYRDHHIKKYKYLVQLCSIYDLYISDEGIKDLIYLKKIYLEYNNIITDYGISKLTNLESLQLYSNNQITNSMRKTFKKLKHVNINKYLSLSLT